MSEPLFDPRDAGVFPVAMSYSLATLCRALHYDVPVVHDYWRDLMGFASITVVRESSLWPPPYAIARHQDGIVLCFDGIWNFRQMAALYCQTTLCQVYQTAGSVTTFLRIWWESIRDNVYTLVNNAVNSSKIVICGYSAGGCIAAIAAQALTARLGAGRVTWGVSFGAPKPGDSTFAEAAPCTFFGVEHVDDVCPAFPLWTTRQPASDYSPSWYALPVNHGAGVRLRSDLGDPTGAATIEYGRNLFTRPTTSVGVVTNTLTGDPGLGEAHKIQTYTSGLRAALPRITHTGWIDRLSRLNRGMDFGTAPADLTTPITQVNTDPVVSGNLPTVAQVQSIPSGNGQPAGPPVTQNTALVGQNVRVVASVNVTRAITASAPLEVKGTDQRMVELAERCLTAVGRRDARLGNPLKHRRVSSPRRLLKRTKFAIDQIDKRDLRAADPRPTRSLSTRAFIIDPDDVALVTAWAELRTQINHRITNGGSVRTPILDQGVASQRRALQLVRNRLLVILLEEAVRD